MENLHQKVKILSEALPYIQQFRKKIIVIKYGGSAMINSNLKSSFAKDIVLLKEVGMNPVVIHGGGPEISHNLKTAKIETKFINGLRVTDAQAIKIVEKTLASINQGIVEQINLNGGRALGVTDYLIKAKRLKLAETVDNASDLGYVGQVVGIASELRELALDPEQIPVISPIGKGVDGTTYNINGDSAASSVAASIRAEKLIMLTDTGGILDENDQLIAEMGEDDITTLIMNGIIRGGMLPKAECACKATQQGVHSAHIIDGRVQHALLLELLTDKGVGTLIRRV